MSRLKRDPQTLRPKQYALNLGSPFSQMRRDARTVPRQKTPLGRWFAIYVGAQDFHHGFGLAEFAKIELAVEAVGITRREGEAAQSLQSWVSHHAFHQPFR